MASNYPLNTSVLSLIWPPYENPQPVARGWTPAEWPIPGLALLWSLHSGAADQDLEWVLQRPPGLPLFIILPPPERILEIENVLTKMADLAPRGVLPSGPVASVESVRTLLTKPRRPIHGEVMEYLSQRGVIPNHLKSELRQLLELSVQARSVTQLCRRMYLSRRTLGRHFEAAGIPAPSHWLQMGRLLHVVVQLQRDSSAVFRIAVQSGYPDGFTLSNQMKRLLGRRPTEIRDALGWEWVVESWLRAEVGRGGFCLSRFMPALRMYADQ